MNQTYTRSDARSRHVRRVLRTLMAVVVAGVLLVAAPGRALAHDGPTATPHTIWSAWNWEPTILVGLLVATIAYVAGIRTLWSRAGTGRGIRRWRAAAFGVSIAVLGAALISPLEALSDALFSVHMVQHLLLILVAAPLLVLSAPTVPMLLALPLHWRRRVGRLGRQPILALIWAFLTHPLLVLVFHLAVLIVWHVPRLYQAALHNEAIHLLEHLSFVITALAFWWVLFHPHGVRRLSYGAGVLYVFATAMVSGVLGALIALAPVPWYPDYAERVGVWGLSPIEDQQLAGVIMWMPASIIYLLAALALFTLWLRSVERDVRRREAHDVPRRVSGRTTELVRAEGPRRA